MSFERPVYVFRKDGNVPVLARATTFAAAYDLTAYMPPSNQTYTLATDLPVEQVAPERGYSIPPLATVVIPTGLHIALPPNHVGLLCSRSGLASKGLMVTNAPGIIDSDYRGEIKVIMTYLRDGYGRPFWVPEGSRIAQLLILPASAINHPAFFFEVDALEKLPDPQSTRVGGLGSTGV